MAVSEIQVRPPEQEPEPPKLLRLRRTPILHGVGIAVVGIVLVWVGLAVMTNVDSRIRAPTVLLGVIALFQAISRVGKAIWGPYWDPGFWLSLIWLVSLTFVAAIADFLPLAEYQDSAKTINIPGNLPPDLFSKHPLGTNNLSLDILARSIYGARVSMLTVTLAISISVVVGGSIGMCAGYFRGWLETVIGLFTDAFLAVPPLILLIALAAVLARPTDARKAILQTGVALAVVSIPTMIRLSRANTLAFGQREFVLSARSIGARSTRIIFRELLPNVALSVLSYALVVMAVLIVAEASLAFLGLGLQEPKPDWGNMIAEGSSIDVLRHHPYIPFVPSVFLFLTVLSLSRVGERARAKWGDPQDSKA